MGHFPHGSSVRQIVHYGQVIAAKQFQLYDYHDKKKNMLQYGQEQPPKVEVEKITDIPIAMISGKYDRIVNIKDNREYAESIPSVFSHIEIEGDHLSFLVGKDMGFMKQVLSMLEDINPGAVDYNEIEETEFQKYESLLGDEGKLELEKVIDGQNDDFVKSMFTGLKNKGLIYNEDGSMYLKANQLDYEKIHLKAIKLYHQLEKQFKVKKILKLEQEAIQAQKEQDEKDAKDQEEMNEQKAEDQKKRTKEEQFING